MSIKRRMRARALPYMVLTVLILSSLVTGCKQATPAPIPPTVTPKPGPEIEILGPADFATVTKGETIIFRASIFDPRGIAATELRVNHDISPEEQVMMNEVPASPPVTELIQHLFWTPMSIGQYTVSVVASNNNGDETESAPITLYVVDNEVQMTSVAEKMITATPTLTPLPTATPTITLTPTPLPPTSTPLPTLTPMPTPTLTPMPTLTLAPTSTSTPWCIDSAQFLADVTLPNDNVLTAGVTFGKTWQLRNTGTCTWDTGYRVVFVGGSQMGASSSVPLTQVVYPNNSVEVTVPMKAPSTPGTYVGQWQMQNSKGQNFGSILQIRIQVAQF
jgi:hypothetical protein